ncbi:MAG: DUF1667 domain-containing protein [Desulfobacteraceae bacterium]
MARKPKKRGRRVAKTLTKEGTKKYICIVCPVCCELETDGKEVEGARCEKGEDFARQEAILPIRVMTTTIRCETKEGKKMIPVKTASPVPLAKIPDIMRHIKRAQFTEIPALGSHITLNGELEPLELIVTGE